MKIPSSAKIGSTFKQAKPFENIKAYLEKKLRQISTFIRRFEI